MNGWFERLLYSSGFLVRFPHYAGVLSKMVPVATNTVPIMAVCLKRLHDQKSGWRLLVNTEYFDQHPEYFSGVLCHEINHAELGHLTNPDYHRVEQPKLMELAMEMAANEGILEPLPEGGIVWQQFTKYSIDAKQSTRQRYQLLFEAYQRGELPLEDYWSPCMQDSHRPGRNSRMGSGLGDALDTFSDGATERNWDRRGEFGKGAPSSNSEVEDMRRRISEFLGGEKGGPDDPYLDKVSAQSKALQRVVMESDEFRSEVNWPQVLQQAFSLRREVTATYLRPNRRFPERIGELPGRKRHAPKPSLLVAVDTSGSMTGLMLDRIRVEIDQLARHSRMMIAECDAAIHRMYPYTGPIDVFTGGGDTLFSPVFDEFRINQFVGIVYFTDGKGDASSLPSSVPTLWIIIGAENIEVAIKKPDLKRGPAHTL